MKGYRHAIEDFLSLHPQKLGCGDINDLLGMLYCCYHQCRGDDTKTIKAKFDQLDKILSKLCLEDNNCMFSVTVSLCQEFQRDAFKEGMLLGFRLYQELEQQQRL